MTQTSRWIYAISFLLAAAGVLLPLWPLCVVGVLMAAFSGRWIFGVIMALVIDIAWGAPTGALQFLFFPFTIVAVAGVLAHRWGRRYVLDKNPQQKI